jgi:hypothetical protein
VWKKKLLFGIAFNLWEDAFFFQAFVWAFGADVGFGRREFE